MQRVTKMEIEPVTKRQQRKQDKNSRFQEDNHSTLILFIMIDLNIMVLCTLIYDLYISLLYWNMTNKTQVLRFESQFYGQNSTKIRSVSQSTSRNNRDNFGLRDQYDDFKDDGLRYVSSPPKQIPIPSKIPSYMLIMKQKARLRENFRKQQTQSLRFVKKQREDALENAAGKFPQQLPHSSNLNMQVSSNQTHNNKQSIFRRMKSRDRKSCEIRPHSNKIELRKPTNKSSDFQLLNLQINSIGKMASFRVKNKNQSKKIYSPPKFMKIRGTTSLQYHTNREDIFNAWQSSQLCNEDELHQYTQHLLYQPSQTLIQKIAEQPPSMRRRLRKRQE